MNFQNDRYTLRYATKEDDAGIREVYESGQFPGNLSVRFLRNPSPYDSFLADAQESRIMVIRDNEENRIIAVGGMVLREEYVSGKSQKCAYLTGLKIHPDYQRKISFIAQSYQFLKDGLGDCSHCYTTILDDNEYAIRMLEKKRKNMPLYHYLGHYTTYCFHGGKRNAMRRFNISGKKGAEWVRLSGKTVEEILKGQGTDTVSGDLQAEIRRVFGLLQSYTFSPCDVGMKGLGEKTFYCFVRDGRIAASCFVGDQSAYKQYEMCAYGGIYKLLSKLPTSALGYPAFPKEKSVIKHGVVSYLYAESDETKTVLHPFLKAVAYEADFELLLWGCFENHPLFQSMNAYKTVHYGSRLYEVDWEHSLEKISKEELLEKYGTIGVEVALL